MPSQALAKKKKPVGRPGWKPSEEILKNIQAMSERGMQKGQIGAYYGFQPNYWCDLQVKFPEITEHIVLGKSRGVSFVLNKLMEQVKAGEKDQIRYYLDRIGGFALDAKINVLNMIDNSTNVNQTNNIQINIEKLDDQALKTLADQAQLLLDSNDHEQQNSKS